VDYIVTAPRRQSPAALLTDPSGLMWPHIGEEQIAAIPVLATMANKK